MPVNMFSHLSYVNNCPILKLSIITYYTGCAQQLI